MLTERLREEAADLGLRVIDVDLAMTEDDLAGASGAGVQAVSGRPTGWRSELVRMQMPLRSRREVTRSLSRSAATAVPAPVIVDSRSTVRR
jgi:hypothetical protein